MTWITLFAAAAFEVVWALALKQSDGFARAGWTVLFAVAVTASMVLLALALRDLPVGTAYAVWTGTGAVGTTLLGILVLAEPATLTRLLPIGLIAAGIVWLALATD